MSQYYFLGGLLSPLDIEQHPDFTWDEFDELLKNNLSEKDQKLLARLRRIYDLQNLRSYWQGMELNPFGNWKVNELEDVLAVKQGIEDYLIDYLDSHDNPESGLKDFSKLWTSLYDYEKEQTDFISFLLVKEWELSLVTALIRSRYNEVNFLDQIQEEDMQDPLVERLAKSAEAQQIDVPEEYRDLVEILKPGEDPEEMAKKYLKWLITYYDDLVEGKTFSSERVMVYVLQFILVEKWMLRDPSRGLKRLGIEVTSK